MGQEDPKGPQTYCDGVIQWGGHDTEEPRGSEIPFVAAGLRPVWTSFTDSSLWQPVPVPLWGNEEINYFPPKGITQWFVWEYPFSQVTDNYCPFP